MSTKEVLGVLYPIILQSINDRGYKWVKSKEALLKKTENGFHSIQIFVDFDSNDNYYIELTIGLRLDAVENIINLFRLMNPQYHKETETFVTTYGVFKNDINFRFFGIGLESLALIAEKIVSFLNETGLPFLEKIDNIEYLQRLYNDERNNPHIRIKATWSIILYGLILAYLVNRPNLKLLIANYEKEMDASKSPNDKMYYPDIFNKVVQYVIR